jgi:CheY-like chemotaxis protein
LAESANPFERLAGLIWRTGKYLAQSLYARPVGDRALAQREKTLHEAGHQKTDILATHSHELLSSRAAPDGGEAAATGAATLSCRVLVVDDNKDAADMVGRLLVFVGHDVVVAYDGEEALAKAASFKPHVGLLDIGMPGMDGYELAARLRNESRPADLFLVAITGWGQEEDRRRALEAGFDAHLTKPADPDAIAELIAARFPAARS